MTRLLTQSDVQLFAMYHRYHYDSDIQAKKKKILVLHRTARVCVRAHIDF